MLYIYLVIASGSTVGLQYYSQPLTTHSVITGGAHHIWDPCARARAGILRVRQVIRLPRDERLHTSGSRAAAGAGGFGRAGGNAGGWEAWADGSQRPVSSTGGETFCSAPQ